MVNMVSTLRSTNIFPKAKILDKTLPFKRHGGFLRSRILYKNLPDFYINDYYPDPHIFHYIVLKSIFNYQIV
ncbi:hypothetical protein ANASTE_01385 [Anaerofustis stercorihominis DSM 17244]|uniref:Uncharacterized protein n=1 Tax=Anaerofustis stercorihominis DSM 17244 TaxID=445971 RepID=B1CBN6_9FIRM|nr:hypothetical protein ANASTE_01385 [Anaerofustis stercorihominis DSM 17244]